MMSVHSFQSSRDPAGIDPSGVDILAGTDPPPDEDRSGMESDPPILPPHSLAGPPPPTPRRTHHPVTHNGIRAPSPVMAFLVGSPPPPPATPPPQKFRSPPAAPPSSTRRRHLPLSPAGDASATTGYSSLSSSIQPSQMREPREPTESASANFVDQKRREALAIYESPNLYMVHDDHAGFTSNTAHPTFEAPRETTVVAADNNNQASTEDDSSGFDVVMSMASPRSAATEPHSNKRAAMRRSSSKRTSQESSVDYQLSDVPSSSSSSNARSNASKKVKTQDGNSVPTSAKKRRGRASTGANNTTRPKTPERRGRGKSSERSKRSETPEREKRGFFRKIFRGGGKSKKATEGSTGKHHADNEDMIQKAKLPPKTKPTNTTASSQMSSQQSSQSSSQTSSHTSSHNGSAKSSVDMDDVALHRVAFPDDPGFTSTFTSHQNAKVSSLAVDTSRAAGRETQLKDMPSNTSKDLDLGFGGLDTVTSGLTNDMEPERRDIFFAHDEVSTLTAPSGQDLGRRNVDPLEASATILSGQSSEPIGHYWNDGNTGNSEATPKAPAATPTIDPFTAPFFQEPDGESPITTKKAKANLQVDVPPTLDPSGETPRAKVSSSHLNEPSPRGWESPIAELKDPLGSTISETNSRRSLPGFGRTDSTQQPKIPPSQRGLPHHLRREPSAFRDGSPYALDPPLRFHDDDDDDVEKGPKNVAGILTRLHSKTESPEEKQRKDATGPDSPKTRARLDSILSARSSSSSVSDLLQKSPEAKLPSEDTEGSTGKEELLPQVAPKKGSPPRSTVSKTTTPPQFALKKLSTPQVDPSPDIKAPPSMLLPESPDTTGFLDDLFQEKPASTHKRPSIVRPISINITEPTNQSTTGKEAPPQKSNSSSQVIEIHRTQRITGSPRSGRTIGGPFVISSNNLALTDVQASSPSKPPASPWTEQRLFNGSATIRQQQMHDDDEGEEKKEQEHSHIYTTVDASPSKAMLATGTAALGTAALMNAKTIAYLHTLNGEPSPRHSWRRPELSDDEGSPPVKPSLPVKASQPTKASPSINSTLPVKAAPPVKASPPVRASPPIKASPPITKASPPVTATPPANTDYQRKAVTSVRVALTKKRAIAVSEHTDEAAFDSFISSGPVSPLLSAKNWRHGRVNFIASTGSEPPSKVSTSMAARGRNGQLAAATSVATSVRNNQPVAVPNRSSQPVARPVDKPTKNIPVTASGYFVPSIQKKMSVKSIPVAKSIPIQTKPKKIAKPPVQSKYGALSPRSRKHARDNFRRPLYLYRFNRDVRVAGKPLSFGLDLQRRKREEDILNGLVIPSRKPKVIVKRRPPPVFQPMNEEDIKDPIQRAGRRLLTKAAVPIQSSARMYLARRLAVQRMEATIVLQSYFRRWQCEAFLRAYKHTCTKIQAGIRSWLVREEIALKHYHAAQIQKVVRGYIAAAYVYDAIYWVSRLQAAFRGKLARLRYNRLLELRQRRAVQLQAWYHGCTARTEAARRREAICVLQNVYRMHSAREKYRLTLVDILRTQSIARQYLARKVTEEKRFVKMNKAARKIQATWRGFQGYTDYIFALVDILVLQRTIRKFLAKTRVKSIRRERAAIKIQAQWRRQTALIGMLYDLVHIIIVQSIARRFLTTRKIIPRMRLEYSLRMEHQQRLDAAAIRIQTAWRGFWGYSHFIIMQYEIIRLQAIIRGRASRILFSLKLGCCIMIQSSVRRFLASKKAFRLRLKRAALGARVEGMRSKLAAQRIQFWWRVVMECSKEKHAALVIERFFMMVKAEVDKEIIRQQQIQAMEEREIQARLNNRDKEQQRKKQEIKKSAADDKLLERVWMNTVDEDDIFGTSPGGQNHPVPPPPSSVRSSRSKSAPRPHQNQTRSTPPRDEAPNGSKTPNHHNNTHHNNNHNRKPSTMMKHRPSSPSNALVMRHEYERSRSASRRDADNDRSRREREHERSSSRREPERGPPANNYRREQDSERDRPTTRGQQGSERSTRRAQENDRDRSNRQEPSNERPTTRRERESERSSRRDDVPTSQREKQVVARKEEPTKSNRRVPRSKPPPDVTLTRSDERTEVSAITSPTVFRKSGGGKKSTKNADASHKTPRKFDEDGSDGPILGSEREPPKSSMSKGRKEPPSSAPQREKKAVPRKTPKSHFFSEETVATTPGGKATEPAKRRHSIATAPSEDSAIISEFSDMPSQLYSRTATTMSRTTATHPETFDSNGGSPRSDVQTEIDTRPTGTTTTSSSQGLNSAPSVEKLYVVDRYTPSKMTAASKGMKLLETVRNTGNNNNHHKKNNNSNNNKSPGSPRHGQIMIKNCSDFPILSQDSRDNVEVEYATEVEQFGMI